MGITNPELEEYAVNLQLSSQKRNNHLPSLKTKRMRLIPSLTRSIVLVYIPWAIDYGHSTWFSTPLGIDRRSIGLRWPYSRDTPDLSGWGYGSYGALLLVNNVKVYGVDDTQLWIAILQIHNYFKRGWFTALITRNYTPFWFGLIWNIFDF